MHLDSYAGTYCIRKYEFGISEALSLRVARRGEAESEVFFERTPLGLCELGTPTYNFGEGGAKSDPSKKLSGASPGYILRNRSTGILLRPY